MFPSKADIVDKVAPEYIAYELATRAGINMPVCAPKKVKGPYLAFLSRRFDRDMGECIHFVSAINEIIHAYIGYQNGSNLVSGN